MNAAPENDKIVDINTVGEVPAQIDQLETMIELSALMNSSLETSDVRQQAIKAAGALVNCEAASLLFINNETGGLYFDVALGKSSDALKTIQLKKGEGIAGWVAERREPIIIGDAQNDPRLFKQADKKSGFRTRNMLCVPVLTKSRVLGVLQAINKRNAGFSDNDARLLGALSNQIGVALENINLYDQLRGSLYGVVQVLAGVIEKRDPFATGHARRVAQYSVGIGKKLGMNKANLVNLKLAASLHDVGMIAVPDEIMQKRARLIVEEKNIVMNHMQMGDDIIKDATHLQSIRPAIKYHHEYFNGTGYFGLAGKKIPLFARIIAVADAFDAMTSERPYMLACGYDAAIEHLQHEAGKLYDESVVKAFIQSNVAVVARKHPMIVPR